MFRFDCVRIILCCTNKVWYYPRYYTWLHWSTFIYIYCQFVLSNNISCFPLQLRIEHIPNGMPKRQWWPVITLEKKMERDCLVSYITCMQGKHFLICKYNNWCIAIENKLNKCWSFSEKHSYIFLSKTVVIFLPSLCLDD